MLRDFNATGADPDREIGKARDPETHLLSIVLEAIQGKRGQVNVFGTDNDTRDITSVRDYILCDFAAAHIFARKRLKARGCSGVYNLSNGSGITVREVSVASKSVTGRTVAVNYGPRRRGNPAVLIADSRRAEDELNWHPRLGSLEDIIGAA